MLEGDKKCQKCADYINTLNMCMSYSNNVMKELTNYDCFKEKKRGKKK